MSDITEEIRKENTKRLDVLHRKHYSWLKSVGMKLSKDINTTEDLIQELYIYLHERCDDKLWYSDSFNLQYCRAFIHSRFFNLCTKNSKFVDTEPDEDIPIQDYDYEEDRRLEEAYDAVLKELDNLKKSKKWSSAQLFELYYFSDKTYEEVSDDINISKSTTFINVRKVKEHMKKVLNNPFDNNKKTEE